MRSILDVHNLAVKGDKFSSPQGDTLFIITHNEVEYTVRSSGKVITPLNGVLSYSLEDKMLGIQSGIEGIVKDFLIIDPSLDKPGSINY